jgi:hypothetical protein
LKVTVCNLREWIEGTVNNSRNRKRKGKIGKKGTQKEGADNSLYHEINKERKEQPVIREIEQKEGTVCNKRNRKERKEQSVIGGIEKEGRNSPLQEE